MAVAEILRELTNEDRSIGLIDLRPCYFAMLSRASDIQIEAWAEDSDELMLAMRDAISEDPIALDPADRHDEWDAQGINLISDLSKSLGIEENDNAVALASSWQKAIRGSAFLSQRSDTLAIDLNLKLDDLSQSFMLDQNSEMLALAFVNLLSKPDALVPMIAAVSIIGEADDTGQFDANFKAMVAAIS